MGRDADYNAITTLILDNRDSIYRLAYSYVHNQADAQDIVQESICKALSSRRSLRQPAHAKAWFYRIVVNTAFDFIRKNKKYLYLEADQLESESCASDPYPDLDLQDTVNKLSTVNRTIIVLRFYEDLELREIADIMDENLSTVKTRLYSSLKKLRLELDETAKTQSD
ncbi:MAG: sigma-70 family RNA polymerase sigma factor [Syntrophomonadaceae bacterium]|nr:sigma-70 family RNA polymerase sigma factor [Syntrophomonadaceae bacterium]